MELTDEFLEGLETNGVCTITHFLCVESVKAINAELLELEKNAHFKKAGIGRDTNFQIDHFRRGDFISWIDQLNAQSSTEVFIQKISEIILQLNRKFYLGIRDFECHYAVYPEGTYYEKHSDRHHSGSHRIVSFVFYLNENWKKEDGGELKIFREAGEPTVVEPRGGNLAIFFSEMEHEVLITNSRRMSITGWMLDEKIVL